jgi:hypothetical protein
MKARVVDLPVDDRWRWWITCIGYLEGLLLV